MERRLQFLACLLAQIFPRLSKATGINSFNPFAAFVSDRCICTPNLELYFHVSLVNNLERSEHLFRDMTNQGLRELHHLLVIAIGLIRFEHRELGVVLSR